LHEHDLGQLFLLKLNELHWDSSFERLLHRLRPGGILVDAPLTCSAEGVSKFLFKASGAVEALPFLALREEGGAMDPLREFLPPLPSPCAVAKKGLESVRRLGELVGAALELLGFNTDLAPLLDLPSPTADHVSQTRAFSADPQLVAKCGAAFLDGLERHGIRACGKHFPGLAGAQSSTPNDLPLVSKSMAQLWREDLVPYRALLPRLPLVLVSTAAYKAYDFDVLQSAALSPKVEEGLLRVKLGFDGVAIAYGLEAKAVRGTLALEEAAVQALAAGCDMLLLEDAGAAERVQAALGPASNSGKLPGPRIQQALERVRHARQGLKPPRGSLPQGSMERLAKEFANFSTLFGLPVS